MGEGDNWQTSFWFLKSLNEVATCTVISTYFVWARLGHTIQINCIKFETVDPYYKLNLRFLEKRMGVVSPPHFVHDFFGKNVSHVIIIISPNFIAWLPYFRYWAIYVL